MMFIRPSSFAPMEEILRWSRVPREVEQPFFAHPICTTTGSYVVLEGAGS